MAEKLANQAKHTHATATVTDEKEEAEKGDNSNVSTKRRPGRPRKHPVGEKNRDGKSVRNLEQYFQKQTKNSEAEAPLQRNSTPINPTTVKHIDTPYPDDIDDLYLDEGEDGEREAITMLRNTLRTPTKPTRANTPNHSGNLSQVSDSNEKTLSEITSQFQLTNPNLHPMVQAMRKNPKATNKNQRDESIQSDDSEGKEAMEQIQKLSVVTLREIQEIGSRIRDWFEEERQKIEEREDRMKEELEQIVRRELNKVNLGENNNNNYDNGSRSTDDERRRQAWAAEEENKRLERENESLRCEIERLQETIKNKDEHLDDISEMYRKMRNMFRELKNDNKRREAEETAKGENNPIQNWEEHLEDLLEPYRAEESGILAHGAQATPGSGGLGVDDAAHGGEEGTKRNDYPRPLLQEEWELEKLERKKKKKNVIMEGLTLTSKTHKKEELESWVWEQLGVKIEIERLSRRGNTWEVSLSELRMKKSLLGKNEECERLGWATKFHEDLTIRQKEIQNWINKEAEAWRNKGKIVQATHHSLTVDETTVYWDELEGELRAQPSWWTGNNAANQERRQQMTSPTQNKPPQAQYIQNNHQEDQHHSEVREGQIHPPSTTQRTFRNSQRQKQSTQATQTEQEYQEEGWSKGRGRGRNWSSSW